MLKAMAHTGFESHHAQNPIPLAVKFPHCELPTFMTVRLPAKSKVSK